MRKRIVLLPGDGIGPEVTHAAAEVLVECAREFGHQFEMIERAIGGAAIDQKGTPLPPETLETCLTADAVLLGAVGGPRWDGLPLGQRPESGLLELRKRLEAYVNLRPVRLRPVLAESSPLRSERIQGVDFEIVRELAGGIYFGQRGRKDRNGSESAFDTESYSTPEIERIARYAFERAIGRRHQLVSIDKANVLESSALWRRTTQRLATEYPRVELRHMYVDNAAMQLVLNPAQFDVILTTNMFGDILSDEAAALGGSIGLLPSASLGDGPGLYEPIHGSSPQLAGKDSACPIGAILSGAMMLRESFRMFTEAEWIEAAVDRALARGYRTADIASPGAKVVGLAEMAEAIRRELAQWSRRAEGYGWGV
jgi:3-isopropylmalate dehydrogenase